MTRSSGSTSTHRDHPSLTGSQISALRRRLEDERAAMLQRATVFVDENGQIDATSATHGQGETEQTAVDIERRVNDVLEAQARDGLEEIDAAIARMEAGTYGQCEDCGQMILGERLVALPSTRFCVTCQARHDARR
jgi:RNA polymerase-binding transcription factor DksA